MSEDVPSKAENAEWAAQYQFWTKIIGDQVARLRWNEGFEPLECDLYELKSAHQHLPLYIGKARICGRDFRCTVQEATDSRGTKILKLFIRVETRKHY